MVWLVTPEQGRHSHPEPGGHTTEQPIAPVYVTSASTEIMLLGRKMVPSCSNSRQNTYVHRLGPVTVSPVVIQSISVEHRNRVHCIVDGADETATYAVH